MKGLLFYDDDRELVIHKVFNDRAEWGELSSPIIVNKQTYPFPKRIEIMWHSCLTRKDYYYHNDIDMVVNTIQYQNCSNQDRYNYIIVGVTPNGMVALWLRNIKKSFILGWFTAKETHSNNITFNSKDYYFTDDYMKQFTYRYLALFGHWDRGKKECQKYRDEEVAPELDYIEEALFDGTHDKLHDGGLMNYHQAGKPKKLAVKWHIKKSEYSAYFWFEDEAIREVFDRFYGVHPDTKTDFMIRIDSDNKKFELALYRYGLKEPQVISDSAYQLIVFKNKFEYYRSENYYQPRGAWIW